MAGTSESGGNDDALAVYASPRVESKLAGSKRRLSAMAHGRALASFLFVFLLGGFAVTLIGMIVSSAYLSTLPVRFFGMEIIVFAVGMLGGLVLGLVSAWESLRQSRRALENGRPREFE